MNADLHPLGATHKTVHEIIREIGEAGFLVEGKSLLECVRAMRLEIEVLREQCNRLREQCP